MDSKHKRRGLWLALLVAGLVLAGDAWATPGGHGGHGHFHGRVHGGAWAGHGWHHGHGPRWYGNPWHGYPRVDYYGGTVIVPPPVYPEPDVWYYCARPRGYYPYVARCMTPWRAVVRASVP
ncbi:hypothetical protein [Janthinobacterium rivuli]|uniref:hypothetical protein n=1 Tax=Janthinobacterium rivuli TaxID=2751478 RepID=UPI000C0E7CF2|nr:hypothetical protein CSQ94_05500 [Janthinobacterium sp. BJB312]